MSILLVFLEISKSGWFLTYHTCHFYRLSFYTRICKPKFESLWMLLYQHKTYAAIFLGIWAHNKGLILITYSKWSTQIIFHYSSVFCICRSFHSPYVIELRTKKNNASFVIPVYLIYLCFVLFERITPWSDYSFFPITIEYSHIDHWKRLVSTTCYTI